VNQGGSGTRHRGFTRGWIRILPDIGLKQNRPVGAERVSGDRSKTGGGFVGKEF